MSPLVSAVETVGTDRCISGMDDLGESHVGMIDQDCWRLEPLRSCNFKHLQVQASANVWMRSWHRVGACSTGSRSVPITLRALGSRGGPGASWGQKNGVHAAKPWPLAEAKGMSPRPPFSLRRLSRVGLVPACPLRVGRVPACPGSVVCPPSVLDRPEHHAGAWLGVEVGALRRHALARMCPVRYLRNGHRS